MSPQPEEDYLLDYEPSVGVSESEQAVRASSPAVSLGGDDDEVRMRRDEDEAAAGGGFVQVWTADGNEEEEQPGTGKDCDLENEEDRLARCPSRLSTYSTATQAEIQSTNWSSSLSCPVPGPASTKPRGPVLPPKPADHVLDSRRQSDPDTLDPDHHLQGWQKLEPNEPRPDSEHTPYRYRLMLPFRNIAKPLRGWSGEHLTKIRQHTNLLKLSVHLDEQKRATCHLVGSQDAIRRAVDGVRRFVYVEQYDKWTAWERERLRSDDWAFFQETWMDIVKGYKLKPFSPRFDPAFSLSSAQQSLGTHSLSPSTSRRRDPGPPLSPRPASPPPYARAYGSSLHPHPHNRPRCRRRPDSRSPPPPPRNASDFDRFHYPPVFDPPFPPPCSTSFNPRSPPSSSSPTMGRLPPSVLPGRESGRKPPLPPRRDSREQHFYDEEQRRGDCRHEPGRRWQDEREKSRRPSQVGGERRRGREYEDERESRRYDNMEGERQREEMSPKRARREEPRRAYEDEAMEAQEVVVVKIEIPPSAAYAFLPSYDPTSMTAVIEHRTGVSLRLQASKHVHELELVAKSEKELKAAIKLVEGEVGMVEDGWKVVLPPPFGQPTVSNLTYPRSRSDTTASTSTRGPPTPSSLNRHHTTALIDDRRSPTPPPPARRRYRSTSSASPRLTRKNSARSQRKERWVRSPSPFGPPVSSVSPEPAEEEQPPAQVIEEERLRSEVEAAMKRKKDSEARKSDQDDEDADAAGDGERTAKGRKKAKVEKDDEPAAPAQSPVSGHYNPAFAYPAVYPPQPFPSAYSYLGFGWDPYAGYYAAAPPPSFDGALPASATPANASPPTHTPNPALPPPPAGANTAPVPLSTVAAPCVLPSATSSSAPAPAPVANNSAATTSRLGSTAGVPNGPRIPSFVPRATVPINTRSRNSITRPPVVGEADDRWALRQPRGRGAGGVWQNGQVVGDGGKRAASAWPGARR